MSRIGHAAKDERGKYSGGQAGDQTGAEVYIRSWYNRPWNVILRAKDQGVRELIAVAMERACANRLIGYDQGQRNTLLRLAREVGYDPAKVSKACETDCSALVALCCMYAGISESALYIGGNSATTSTLRKHLKSTGKFEELTDAKYLSSPDYLLRGDILLYEGHHVAVNLEDGSKAIGTVKKNTTLSIRDYIRIFQAWLNDEQPSSWEKLATDGSYGPKTKKAAVAVLQIQTNNYYDAGLRIDGSFGPLTKGCCGTIRKGNGGSVVHLLQGMLYCKGYDPGGLDYSFGSKTDAAVRAFQKASGITVDGIVGGETWAKLFG